DNLFRMSKYALDYASEYHFQSIKIECNAKIKDQGKGSKYIQALLNYIKVDFLSQNVSYTKPLLFDLRWIDRDGNIQAISKSTEIIVYLSQANRLPKELNDIKIILHPPRDLPPQYTAILKWAKSSVSFDDIKMEITAKYKSLCLSEETMGTKSDRNRNLRIELLDNLQKF
ncbi:unnamed protein product, partial [Rotaria sp. Silwood2]